MKVSQGFGNGIKFGRSACNDVLFIGRGESLSIWTREWTFLTYHRKQWTNTASLYLLWSTRYWTVASCPIQIQTTNVGSSYLGDEFDQVYQRNWLGKTEVCSSDSLNQQRVDTRIKHDQNIRGSLLWFVLLLQKQTYWQLIKVEIRELELHFIQIF